MKQYVDQYLEAKSLSWSLSTQKSEAARLRKHSQFLELGPQAHFLKFKGKLGAYTLKTLFIRLSDFNQWLVDQNLVKKNEYRAFMKSHERLFKHVYEKEKLSIDYHEAKKRIYAISDLRIREKAEQLLRSGARWSESKSLDSDGMVTGKGGKKRKLFNVEPIDFKLSYSTFIQRLKSETGLKPHSLRKLLATELSNQGFSDADLMQVFGWSSMQTAASYTQSKREEVLATKLAAITSK